MWLLPFSYELAFNSVFEMYTEAFLDQVTNETEHLM